MTKKLFEINPDLDRAALARRFAEHTRVQVRDFLTRETAEEIRMILQPAKRRAETMSFLVPFAIAGRYVMAGWLREH